jgi:hypothetical protein
MGESFEWRGLVRSSKPSKERSGKGSTRCSRCGGFGHNVVRCSQTEVTRTDRFCSDCGVVRPWSHSGGKSDKCITCSRKARAIKSRACLACGGNFVPKEGDRKVCSEECRRIHLSNLHTGTHERLTGKTFGWWTVLSHAKADECISRCRCGHESIIGPSALSSGASMSCRRCVAARRLEGMTTNEIDALEAGRRVKQRERDNRYYERNKATIQERRSQREVSVEKSREYNARAAERLRGVRVINRALVNKLKAAPCMDCNTAFPAVCMDFDHRPGEVKVGGVSELAKAGRSTDVLLAEIAKCDLVCSNCHRVRTYNRHHEADESDLSIG